MLETLYGVSMCFYVSNIPNLLEKIVKTHPQLWSKKNAMAEI